MILKMAGAVVRLRVGGEIFETTRETLMFDEDSFFHAMLRCVKVIWQEFLGLQQNLQH